MPVNPENESAHVDPGPVDRGVEPPGAWSRRCVLRGVAVAGTAITVPVLAACGGGDTDSDNADENGGSGAEGNGTGAVLAQTDEIEVGGGLVLDDEEMVITQPEEGEFRAFSNVCPHQQNPVDEVADGTINCPWHGSRFNVADGSVEAGPAEEPLPEVEVMVDGDQIVRA